MKHCNFRGLLKLPVILWVSFLFNHTILAQLQNWRYEVPVTVNNSSNLHLNNYQALLVINTRAYINAGYMQPDGRDIRFASSCGSGLIDYCLENYINTDSTRIWVKLSSLAPYTSMVIYLYMGNPSAISASTLTIFEGPHSSTDHTLVSPYPKACSINALIVSFSITIDNLAFSTVRPPWRIDRLKN